MLDLSCFGLEWLLDDDVFMGVVGEVVKKGKPVSGYYGLPYINHDYGWLQMIARTGYANDQSGMMQVKGIDTHCSGIYVWNVRIIDEIPCSGGKDPLQRRLLVSNPDREGGAMISVVNADVLPSFLPGEEIELQVVALAKCVQFYKDEEAFLNSIRPDLNGIRFSPAANSIIAEGLLSNDDDKDLVRVCGTIEDVMLGEVEIAEQKFNCFVDCVVSTQFGGLEILFPRDGVEPEQYQYIKIGAFIDCYAYLSGDAAIHQHETGIVRDKDSNLRLVAFTFGGGAPERLERVMASDVRFDSECSDTHLSEREEIIAFMKEVQKDGPRCYPKYAIIAGKAEDLGPRGGLKGIALYYEGNNECSGVAAVTSDAEGFITSISVFRADQISFQLIEQEEETETGTVLDLKESILARAHMFRLVEDDVSVSDVESYIQAHKDELTGFRNCPDENRPMADVFTDAYNKGLQRSGHEGLSEKETASIGLMFYNDYARTDSCEMQDILCFIECIGAMYRGRAD